LVAGTQIDNATLRRTRLAIRRLAIGQQGRNEQHLLAVVEKIEGKRIDHARHG
jgi:hypothetical protein